jgi:hypothetical protein
MTGETRLLRLGEYLVRRASQGLPKKIRDERYREWTAELPAILHDPQVRFAPIRAIRMLAYTADILRASTVTPARTIVRSRSIVTFLVISLAVCLAVVAWDCWIIVQAPRHGLGYAQLAWSLVILACPIGAFARVRAHVATLIVIGSTLTGVAVNLWAATLVRGSWANYLVAALLPLTLLGFLVSRRTRAKRA